MSTALVTAPTFMDVIADYPENVREQMCRVVIQTGDRLMRRVENDIMWALNRYGAALESPLEVIFLAHWAARDIVGAWDCFQLTPQYPISGGRVDFMVTTDEPPLGVLAIELDGHEFHEKTKEQVVLRNTRDRMLLADGLTVFHFSGTELYRDPMKCLDEIALFLQRYRCLELGK